VFLNTADFFRPLLGLFEQLYHARFTRSEHRELYHVSAVPGDVFAYLENYQPPKPASKWFSAR
jgi:predicted Rossmann-fold nucleotide-binding protein